MEEIFSKYPAYCLMATLGTSLFILKLVLFIFTGDGEEIDSTETFSFLSIQSILAFFRGAGWAGLASKIEWELSSMLSIVASVVFGFLMMLLSRFLSFKKYRPKGKGMGQNNKFYRPSAKKKGFPLFLLSKLEASMMREHF